MNSSVPKVLQRVCGRPMVRFVLDVVAEAGFGRPVVVVGRGADDVRAEVGEGGVTLAEQPEQRGTADAVRVGLGAAGEGEILVLYGDVPLVRAATLRALVARHREARPAITMLTARLDEPTGYGRIVRGPDGGVARIVEQADATAEERAITEINPGTYVFDGAALREGLGQLQPANAQGEYYLTDLIGWALSSGRRVEAVPADDPAEVLGVNSRRDLALAEAAMRARLLEGLMDAGVTILDPRATYVHAGVSVGEETVIHPGCSLEGTTRVGGRCVLGPDARLVDAVIGDRVTILASTVVQSTMDDGSRIGPYSHLRPGTRVGKGVEIGNFAEMKNSTIGDGSKVHHKSYLGDATLGQRVNVGAGTITCNLRDRSGKKWPTIIEDEAFIGSDSMLVAPVRIGRGATTGAGSVVTKDVPAGAVVVGVPARILRPGPAPAAAAVDGRKPTAGKPARPPRRPPARRIAASGRGRGRPGRRR